MVRVAMTDRTIDWFTERLPVPRCAALRTLGRLVLRTLGAVTAAVRGSAQPAASPAPPYELRRLAKEQSGNLAMWQSGGLPFGQLGQAFPGPLRASST